MDDGWRTITHRDLGHRNRSAVLRELVLHGPRSRRDIAARIELTQATVSRITRELIGEGLVQELPRPGRDAARGPGRIPIPLDIAPNGGQVLGVVISPASQTVTLSDLKNRTIAETGLEIGTLNDPDLFIRDVADRSRRLIAACRPDRRRLLGGFVAIAATLDRARGSVRRSRYLEWGEVPLADRLSERLGLPMKVESIPVAVALAEARFGAARERDSTLVLICGLGLGAGLIVNGGPVTGHGFAAGAIGLVPVVDGESGVVTFDRLAGGFRILRSLRSDTEVFAMTARERIDLLDEAIAHDRDGSRAVAALMADAGRALGRVVAQFVYLLAPEIVVLTGPLARAPSYLDAVRATVADAVAEGLGDESVEVATGVAMDAGGGSAACGLAIWEYLLERAPGGDALDGASVRGDAQ